MREKVRGFVDSMPFKTFIMIVIVINAVTIGLQTGNFDNRIYNALVMFDNVCLVIYIIEAILKIYAYGHRYFLDGWNIFDFVIIILSCLPSSILPASPQVARIIRIFRTFKAFRLVSAFRQTRVIVNSITKSLPCVFWTCILMALFFYIYAVIGTVSFAEIFPDYFGNIAASMYTLFQVMTLDGWSSGVCRPVMEVYSWASVYFVSFVIINAFVIINLVVNIVVAAIDASCENLKSATSEQQEAQEEALGAIPAKPADELAQDELAQNSPAQGEFTQNPLAQGELVEGELAEIKNHLEALERLVAKQNETIEELTASQGK